MYSLSIALGIPLCILSLVLPATAAPVVKRSVSGPVISSDFPDPSILHVGNTWYAFASQSIYDHTNIHIQVATSTDFNTWTLHQGQDALPNLPGWAQNDGNVWAPDVNQLDDGTFIMYFSATDNADPGHHCVGTATSTSPTGPFTASGSQFACPTGQGGALDASGFRDSNGARYVTYKIDGNSLGHGGSCNNGVAPVVNTPILVQPVQADGVTKIGSASTVLNLDPADGPDIEAPAMIRDAAGTYILFFSSNCYSTPLYDISYAYSNSPTGGFTKSSTPFKVAGNNGLSGPGGADVSLDGVHMLFHGLQSSGRRFLYTAIISANGNGVSG